VSGPVSTADAEPVDGDRSQTPTPPTFERFASRVAQVGGASVRRALPRRQRRTIGAWCFIDHFGPVTGTAAMQIGPHPHIGLQTVTWLLSGEVHHVDSLGSDQLIRPGELNLMTAANGVVHAEESRASSPVVQHGAQLWVALPDATRRGEPAFQHLADLPRAEFGPIAATILLGELDGHHSPARTDTPLIGVALEGLDDGSATMPLDPSFEYGVVVFGGKLEIGAETVAPGELVYLGRGRDELPLGTSAETRALLVGGEPLTEPLLMWWNFVARTRAEIDAARADWTAGTDRFGPVASSLARIPAPTG
jgi:redox-sensitive bicupin YhaK (pirin superfamily)